MAEPELDAAEQFAKSRVEHALRQIADGEFDFLKNQTHNRAKYQEGEGSVQNTANNINTENNSEASSSGQTYQYRRFTKFLMLPFKILYPPLLNTPISTIELPRVIFTMPLVFISFFISFGGFVFCYVNHASFYDQSPDRQGRTHTQWYRRELMDEVVFEAIIVGAIFSSISSIAICAYYALSNKNTKSFSYKMLYRFGCTLPIWILLGFQMFHLKIPQYFPRFTL